MNKKKILIILYVVFLSVCLILTIFFGGQKKKPAPATEPPKQTEGQENSSSNTNLSQPSISIENPSSKESIQQAFNDFKKLSQEDLHWTLFVDKDNKIIGLQDFFAAMDAKINPELNDLLDQNNYMLFSCGYKNNRKEMGIVLTVKVMPDFQGDLEEEQKRIMKEWEGTLFQDTRTIIFPNDVFSEEQIKQKLSFSDGKYRYAEVAVPNNQKDSLNYTVVYENIIISNSPDCISKTIEGLTI
jgi:hypothetical protein